MRKISENKRKTRQKLAIFVLLVTSRFETIGFGCPRHQFPIHLFNYPWYYNMPRVYISLGPVYEFVCISFRTDNLNCFRVK